MENTIKIVCPYCKQPLAFKRPDNAYGVTLTCPKCKETIRVKIREKAIRLPEQQEEESLRMAHLEVVPMTDGVSPQIFYLKKGNNVIGRHDTDTIQDISIDGDLSMSRRSVNLTVEQKDNTFMYKLSVLNAKNPVYVNHIPLNNGNSMTLRIGDTIKMGATKLKLTL